MVAPNAHTNAGSRAAARLYWNTSVRGLFPVFLFLTLHFFKKAAPSRGECGVRLTGDRPNGANLAPTWLRRPSTYPADMTAALQWIKKHTGRHSSDRNLSPQTMRLP
jgi:hypothetical protein